MVLKHSGKERRGRLRSLVQTGFPAGMMLAPLAFRAVSKLPEADFLSCGWRIPFLAGVALVFIGLFVRLRLTETPPLCDPQARRATSSRRCGTCSRTSGSRA